MRDLRLRDRLLFLMMDVTFCLCVTTGVAIDVAGGEGWNLIAFGMLMRVLRHLETECALRGEES